MHRAQDKQESNSTFKGGMAAQHWDVYTVNQRLMSHSPQWWVVTTQEEFIDIVDNESEFEAESLADRQSEDNQVAMGEDLEGDKHNNTVDG